MTDYAIVYLIMVAAGILLGSICLLMIIKGKKKDYAPISSSSFSAEDLPAPPIELAKEIVIVYSHNSSADNAVSRVWVCRDCEVENSMDNSQCILCGAWRS